MRVRGQVQTVQFCGHLVQVQCAYACREAMHQHLADVPAALERIGQINAIRASADVTWRSNDFSLHLSLQGHPTRPG